MEAEDSFFVVFRTPAQAATATVPKPTLSTVATLGGPWDVSLQPKQGAPAELRLATLTSLSEQADPSVKYFSGMATYTRDFSLPKGTRPGTPLVLDLGRVGTSPRSASMTNSWVRCGIHLTGWISVPP